MIGMVAFCFLSFYSQSIPLHSDCFLFDMENLYLFTSALIMSLL